MPTPAKIVPGEIAKDSDGRVIGFYTASGVYLYSNNSIMPLYANPVWYEPNWHEQHWQI